MCLDSTLDEAIVQLKCHTDECIARSKGPTTQSHWPKMRCPGLKDESIEDWAVALLSPLTLS